MISLIRFVTRKLGGLFNFSCFPNPILQLVINFCWFCCTNISCVSLLPPSLLTISATVTWLTSHPRPFSRIFLTCITDHITAQPKLAVQIEQERPLSYNLCPCLSLWISQRWRQQWPLSDWLSILISNQQCWVTLPAMLQVTGLNALLCYLSAEGTATDLLWSPPHL